MATIQTCDLCDNEAIDAVEVKSKTTTTIKLDVCIEHLAEFKKLVRVFTGQELKEEERFPTILHGKITPTLVEDMQWPGGTKVAQPE